MTEELTITIDNGVSRLTVGGANCEFKLMAYSGLAAADFDVQMSAGGASDGGYITSARLSSRTLDMKFDFGGSTAEAVRQSLIPFFAPARRLTVTVQRGGVVRKIEGHTADFDISEKNRYARSVVNLSVLCPDPYFKADAMGIVTPAVQTPLFRLPCHSPFAVGVISHPDDLEIFNSGDTYADMIAELAADTAVTNPFILNRTNGKRIKASGTLSSGSILRISTVRRAKGAWINGAACLIDPVSQFSDFLETGLNQLTFGSDEGTGNISASVQCTSLFYGI